ncbi:hypothetical protein ACC730_37885, partial [Rhizobium ruizarguesonis]
PEDAREADAPVPELLSSADVASSEVEDRHVLIAVSKCELPLIEERVTAEIVLRQIGDLEKDFGSQAIGIAAALAEGGLVPLY